MKNKLFSFWLGGWFTWWAVGTAAVSLVGGAVLKNNGPKVPTPASRDLNSELGNLSASYPSVLNNLLGGQSSFTSNSLSNLGSLTGGQFDANKFFSDQPDWADAYQRDKALNYAEHPERAGWTPEQYAQYAFGGDKAQVGQYQNQGGIPQLSTQLNTQTRTANLQDAQNLGSQYTALTRGANPDYYNALNSYTSATQQPVSTTATQNLASDRAAQGFGTPTGSPLLSQLNTQAMNAGPSSLQQQQNALASGWLSQGGQLSPSELRNVQQNSRAGFAARGLDATNASVVDETMQTDAAQRARLLQNLGMAQSVQNQGLAEQNQQNQFGLGVSNQNYGYGQLGLQSQTAQQTALMQSAALQEQQRQAQLGQQGNAVQLQRGGYLDPYAAILGGADQNLLGQVLGTNQANQSNQTNLYGALLGYGQDLNNTNYNANAAANIAGYNSNQALYGSLISAGSNLGGAYLASKGGGSGGYTGSVTNAAGNAGNSYFSGTSAYM